jgi:hypothetical protein
MGNAKQYESEAEHALPLSSQRRKTKRQLLESESSANEEQSLVISHKRQITTTKRAAASKAQASMSSGGDSEEVVSRSRRRPAQRRMSSSDSAEAPVTRRRRPVVQQNANSTILEMPESSAVEDVRMQSEEDDDEEPQHTMLRNQKSGGKCENGYDYACQKLQLSAVPSKLPCRDAERQQITDYILNGLKNKGSSSSLYISGMPGTGKTATTLEVINSLKQQRSLKFDFVHINAMSLNNPNLVYTIIYKAITGRSVNPGVAALFLDEFFKKKDKNKILMKTWGATLAKKAQA